MAEIANRNSEGQAPLRRLRITIDESQRDELFAQLREFAAKHALEILKRKAGSNYEGFFIEMLRDDLYINASITRVDPKIVSLRFFDQDPTNPPPQETVDELFRDLKSFINEIPNVAISKEK